MGILGLIPARGGSKGIPRKNVYPLNGVPLVNYTIEAALGSGRLDRTVLSTDDEEIAEVGRRAGAEVPFLRPAELAQDASTLEEVLDHLLARLEADEGYVPDAVMILQPTLPLRTAAHVVQAVDLLESSGANTVVAVSEPTEHPAEMVFFEAGKMRFVLQDTGFRTGVQRQGYDEVYFLNGAIFLTRTASYREQGTRFAAPVVPLVMDPLDSIDIDAMHDLIIAELLLKRRAGGARG